MKLEFQECRRVLLDATLKALRESADRINAIERTGRGDLPVTGFSLDLFPWFGDMTLSIRISSDWPCGRHAYDIGDWKHHDFLKSWGTDRFKDAGKFIQAFYQAGPQPERRDRAHLVFLAGAEALLDPRVAAQLQLLGIDAPVVEDRFGGDWYIVVDEDGSIRANYCEIVLANRITNRLIGGEGRTRCST